MGLAPGPDPGSERHTPTVNRRDTAMMGDVMFKGILTVAAGLSVAMLCGAGQAQQLPKSGTFSINSGWKANGELVQVGEGRMFGWGGFYGVTFNQRGSGPLHMGQAVCSYTLDLTAGAGPGRGACAWTDADGDKIFTDYTGTLGTDGVFNGMNQITGGTGKFSGITGKAAFQAKALSTQGHFGATQQFEYRLP